MVKPSPLNPLSYLIDRQYNENIVIKNQIFKQRLANARNLFRKDLLAHYGCVNAIEFSNEGDLLISGGDDRRVLLWCVPEAMFGRRPPVVMETNHNSNIFCLGFDSGNTKIFSGGNDDQVIIHDAITGNLVGKLPHKKPVYGLSLNPQNDYVIATAGDDGRILLFDVRESPNSDAVCLAKKKTGFHSVMFNPTNPRWLTTANSDEGIALWDCRKPKELLIHYDANAGPISGISACFNSDGTRVLALRRRLPPVLYATQRENAICQFYHPQYYNSCTMKTCCFAGDNDEYVLSGSDDFNLYMWRIPENDSIEWGRSHLILHGHRSIVNQVRYNKTNNMIASSGVEKMVKLWSTLSIGTWKGSLIKEHTDLARTVYSHEDYIYLVGHSGERISHDYSDHSTQEDSKMMAFFDSLIQREIEGWETSENSDYSDSDSDNHERSILNEMFSNCKLPLDDHKKYKTNRIAQLIAKKRSRLARMAHEKSSSSIQGNYLKEKNKKKKTAQKTAKFKKHNGINKKSLTNRHFDKERHRSTINERHNNNNSKLRKYRTRQSIKDELLYESNSSSSSSSSTSNNSFDAPSTSTGITSSNNSVYRLIEQDSDEDLPSNSHNNNNNINNSNDNSNLNNCIESNSNNDDDDEEEEEENNFVNILPTPLNGTHDMYINVLEMTSSNGNVVTIRNEEYNRASTTTTNNNNDNDIDDCNTIAASTSNNKRRLRCFNNNSNNSFYGDTESDSDYEFDYCTPIKKRRTISASDSGCGTSGPCSSTSPYPYNHNTNNKRNFNSNHNNNNNNNNHQECSNNNNNNNLYNNNDHSSDDEINYEKFKKRINKARMNIRKQIAGADSDSN